MGGLNFLVSLFGIILLATLASSAFYRPRQQHFRTWQQFPSSRHMPQFPSFARGRPSRIVYPHQQFPNIFRRYSRVRGMRYPIHVQSQHGPFYPYQQGRFQVPKPFAFHGLRQRSGYFPYRRTQQFRRFSRVPPVFARDPIRIAPSIWGSPVRLPLAFLSGGAIPRGFPAPILSNWNHVIDQGFPRTLRPGLPRPYFPGGNRRHASESAHQTLAVPHAIIGWVGEDDDENSQISQISIGQGGQSVRISSNGNSEGLGSSIIIDDTGIHTRVGGSITLQGHETVDAEPEVAPIVNDGQGQTPSKLADKKLLASAGASATLVTAAVDTAILGTGTELTKSQKEVGDKKTSQLLISGSKGVHDIKTDHVQTSLSSKSAGHKEMHSVAAGQKIIETVPVVEAGITIDKHVKGIDASHKDHSIILNPIDANIHNINGQGKFVVGGVETVSTDVKASIKDVVAEPVVLDAPVASKPGAGLSKPTSVIDLAIKDADTINIVGGKDHKSKVSKPDIATKTKLASTKVTEQKIIKPKAVIDLAIKDADKVNVVGAIDKKGKIVKTDTVSAVKIASAEVKAEKIIAPVIESVVAKTSTIIGSETGIVKDTVGAQIVSKKGDLPILAPEAKKVDKIVPVKQVVEKVVPIKKL